MTASHAAIAATVYRGPAIENTHLAHVAVVDATGRLLHAFGNSHRPTLPRSAVKPAQALAALARIYRAMTAHPELVAGSGRLCTALMRAFDGAVVGKIGADASYAIGVRDAAYGSDGKRGPLGIAVKVEDGNVTALMAIVVELLHQLNIGTAAQRAQLDDFHRPVMRNTVGLVTGRLALSVKLEQQH